MAMVMENQHPVAPMQLVTVPTLPPPPPPPPPPPFPPYTYKHHCKVCKKGYMCGRALGGHMRAHGVNDDGLSADDALDDDSGPCGAGAGDSSEAGSASTTTKRMYALRANPVRQKNCRVCENCGKEFTSWNSLLDHGRCNNEEGDDMLDGSRRSSPLRDDDDDGEGDDLALAAGWSKGKRTRRAKVMVVGNGSMTEVQSPSSEEEDLANCLVMLSSSRVAQPPVVVDADQESCASASKDEERNRLLVPQPISMVAPAVPQLKLLAPPQVVPQFVSTVPRGLFECKACKKVFTSHQALGGHRASHKKVKGCFAAKFESNHSEPPQHVAAAPHDNVKAVADAIADISTDPNTASVDANADGNTIKTGTTVVVMATTAPEMAIVDEAPGPAAVSPFKKKGKVHECSICHRVFMSGQALGGHKRCHWLTTASGDPTSTIAKLQPFVAQDHVMSAMCQQLNLGRPMLDRSDPILDLNVPTNPSAEQVATRQAAELNDGALCLNAPASLYMQSWTGQSNASNVNRTATSSRNDAAGAAATEDEADSTNAKRAKISDLKDLNVAGETSWLQVGIGLPSESKEKNIQE
ncbi:uncharacterized protein LOC133917633 [Phragmites australis]|uniref:uncharacterized protein LOC133917633 n=1 Tax=Phragmites australis TaxID=29695 RepID=UPI002D7A2EED|nr:uncharacterized protein LOC133917633 [Phragmites australis]